MRNRYPIYVVSKGRWDSRLTVKALEKRSIDYRIVIEPQEYDQYAAVIDPSKILVLPFSNLGQGSIPARNWIWEHAIQSGAARHWILDDNIREFYYLHNNVKWHTTDATTFRIIEDFADRYENVALAGMQYEKFAPRRQAQHPLILNTRIYSCILIDNSLPFRWRGKYNEDTDLSLRALKAGFCTVLFVCCLAEKITTMRMRGGNTDELYRRDEHFDGRLEMARSLQRQHPDVVQITWKWNRWQHKVDYSPFKNNRLRPNPDAQTSAPPPDYGLRFVVDDTDISKPDATVIQSRRDGKESNPKRKTIRQRRPENQPQRPAEDVRRRARTGAADCARGGESQRRRGGD